MIPRLYFKVAQVSRSALDSIKVLVDQTIKKVFNNCTFLFSVVNWFISWLKKDRRKCSTGQDKAGGKHSWYYRKYKKDRQRFKFRSAAYLPEYTEANSGCIYQQSKKSSLEHGI